MMFLSGCQFSNYRERLNVHEKIIGAFGEFKRKEFDLLNTVGWSMTQKKAGMPAFMD